MPERLQAAAQVGPPSPQALSDSETQTFSSCSLLLFALPPGTSRKVVATSHPASCQTTPRASRQEHRQGPCPAPHPATAKAEASSTCSTPASVERTRRAEEPRPTARSENEQLTSGSIRHTAGRAPCPRVMLSPIRGKQAASPLLCLTLSIVCPISH